MNRRLIASLAELSANLRHRLGPILLVGLAGGLTGLAFLSVLHVCESILSPEGQSPWLHLPVLMVVGLAVSLLTRWLGQPGDVELLVDNIHVLGGGKTLRDLRSLLPVSLLCIAAGGAAGPESPLVQTTGSIGTWTADRTKLGTVDRRVLTITGMAAGFTVLFGAPLGGAIFALELLHRRGLEYYEALIPAVIGSLCGYSVFVCTTGLGLSSVWHFPPPAAMRPIDLAWAVGAGALAAGVAIVFTWANLALRHLFTRIPAFYRPIAGGAALGALALASPWALTFGEAQIDSILVAKLSILALAVAALAKFLATSVTLASGWRGGFIIPLFFVGMALGRLCHQVCPGTQEVLLTAALMAAINAGVTKTPLGSTLVVTKMAGLQLLPTTLLASIVALLLTSNVGLIHSQRPRDHGQNPPDVTDRHARTIAG